ncbi:MAG: acyltransferase family protein [Sphingomonas sp.]
MRVTGEGSGTRLGYIPAVDGLRAVAVLSVILFHLRPAALPGGFTGVDIFFVISGFVVTGSVTGRRFASLREMLAWFYARRLMRIMPALIAMLLATVLAAQLFIPDAWLSNTVAQVGRFAFFGLSNIVLATDTDSYFSPLAAYNPFTHTWSLGVEEQFYLVFPLLLFWRLRSGKEPMREGRTIAIVAALTLASLAACWGLSTLGRAYAFYLIPARFWELGTGMLLCLTAGRWRPWLGELRGLHQAELTLVSAALVGGGLAIPEGASFPFPLALLPVLGTAGLIAVATAVPASPATRLLAWRPVVAVGLLSYSLYLWHWPVFVLFRWTAGLHTLPLQLLALAIAVALAAASYFLVEKPLRASRRIAALPRGRVVAGALGAVLLSGGAGFAAIAAHDRISLSVTRDHAAWYADERYPVDPATSKCRVRWARGPAGATNLYMWTPEDCAAPRAGFTVHAIGDSHAIAYTPVYRRLVAELGIGARAWARPNCPFLKLNERANPFCAPIFAAMVADLRAKVRPGDVIFLPSLRQTRFINQFGADRWPKGRPDDHVSPETLDEARTWLRALARTGAPILIEAPKPLFRSPAFRCSDWFNRANPICAGGLEMDRAELLRLRAPVMAAIAQLAREVPGGARVGPLPDPVPARSVPCRARRPPAVPRRRPSERPRQRPALSRPARRDPPPGGRKKAARSRRSGPHESAWRVSSGVFGLAVELRGDIVVHLGAVERDRIDVIALIDADAERGRGAALAAVGQAIAGIGHHHRREAFVERGLVHRKRGVDAGAFAGLDRLRRHRRRPAGEHRVHLALGGIAREHEGGDAHVLGGSVARIADDQLDLDQRLVGARPGAHRAHGELEPRPLRDRRARIRDACQIVGVGLAGVRVGGDRAGGASLPVERGGSGRGRRHRRRGKRRGLASRLRRGGGGRGDRRFGTIIVIRVGSRAPAAEQQRGGHAGDQQRPDQQPRPDRAGRRLRGRRRGLDDGRGRGLGHDLGRRRGLGSGLLDERRGRRGLGRRGRRLRLYRRRALALAHRGGAGRSTRDGARGRGLGCRLHHGRGGGEGHRRGGRGRRGRRLRGHHRGRRHLLREGWSGKERGAQQ